MNIVSKTISTPSIYSANQSFHSGGLLYRRVGSKIIETQYPDLIKQAHSLIKKHDVNTPDYIRDAVALARLFSSFQPIEININLLSGCLENIVNSDEACIFVINHDHQVQDPVLLSMFNILLYEKYIEANKAATCPRPKIILNQDILSTKEKKHREIYEALGAVGVDIEQNLSFSETRKNSKSLLHLIQDFCADKNHIFIFPEGRKSAYKNLDLKEKFQVGIGHVVRTALKRKKQVKVIPLGFAFNSNNAEKQPLGSIYVGKPIYFKKDGKQICTSTGNISFESASPSYRNFFYCNSSPNTYFGDDVPFKVITHNGVAVTDHTQQSYIGDILAENLQICRQMALQSLPQNPLKEDVITL